MKKIVTSNINGKSTVIVNVEPYNANFKDIGISSREIWSTKQGHEKFSEEDVVKGFLGIPPPKDGTIFRVVDFSPNESKKRFMHKTSSLDYAIILKGSITLVLDTEEVDLSTGDCIVQQGTNHAWVNKTNNITSIAFILIDKDNK